MVVTTEAFGLTRDVVYDGGQRRWLLRRYQCCRPAQHRLKCCNDIIAALGEAPFSATYLSRAIRKIRCFEGAQALLGPATATICCEGPIPDQRRPAPSSSNNGRIFSQAWSEPQSPNELLSISALRPRPDANQ